MSRDSLSRSVSVELGVAEYCLESAMMLRKRLEIAPNSPEYKRVCEIQTALENAIQCGTRSEIAPSRKRLVYNKATKKIDVVRSDGLVTDSFDPPHECDTPTETGDKA